MPGLYLRGCDMCTHTHMLYTCIQVCTICTIYTQTYDTDTQPSQYAVRYDNIEGHQYTFRSSRPPPILRLHVMMSLSSGGDGGATGGIGISNLE